MTSPRLRRPVMIPLGPGSTGSGDDNTAYDPLSREQATPNVAHTVGAGVKWFGGLATAVGWRIRTTPIAPYVYTAGSLLTATGFGTQMAGYNHVANYTGFLVASGQKFYDTPTRVRDFVRQVGIAFRPTTCCNDSPAKQGAELERFGEYMGMYSH